MDPAADVEELIYAYRVPREIMEVALPVLALTAPSLTRATQTLTCIHSEPLPWPLGSEVGPAPLAEIRPLGQPPAIKDAELESAASPASEPPSMTAALSVGEALVLARMRGLDLSEAL